MAPAGRPLVAFALLLASSGTLVTRSARSEEAPAEARLGHVEELVRKADFDRAGREGEELLDSGDLPRHLVVRLSITLGIVAAARGDQPSAEAAFTRALRLDAAAELPSSAGPHVVDVFTRARRNVESDQRLRVRAELHRSVTQLDVRLWVDGPGDELVHTIVVTGPSFRRVLAVDDRPTLTETIALPPGPCIELVAGVADVNGNVLWPELARAEPCATITQTNVASPAAVPSRAGQRGDGARGALPETAPSTAIPIHVWVGGGVTVGLAAATTYFGLKALDARSEYHEALRDPTRTYEAKRALHDDATKSQLVPSVVGVATAVVGAATVVLFFTRPNEPPVALTPRVTSGGMLLDLHGRF